MDNQVRRALRLGTFLLALGFALSVGILPGQIAGNGSIQGTILDPTGAVVPGAAVTARNVATGVAASTVSTSAGFYVFPALPVGEYRIAVTANGFSTTVQDRVVVNALSVVPLTLTLNVGQTTQEVQVTTAPPQLETTTGALSVTVENKAYASLPLAMSGGPRSPEGFIALLPGVSGSSSGSLGSFGAYSINGGEQYSKEIYVNGIPVTTSRLQGDNRNLTVSVEAIEQFQVVTNGTPAQYQGQGTENFVLKSGTNRFHGGLFEYVRNNAFDARGFFAAKAPVAKQNEFGGSVGGPIRKDRVFFFGTYGGYRIKQANTSSFTTIATPGMRDGNFSVLPVAIYNPKSTACPATGPCTRQPFAGNIIPQSLISPISKSLQSNLPPVANAALQNNFTNVDAPGPGNSQNGFTSKVDANLTGKNRMFGAVSWSKYSPTSLGGSLPLPYTSGRYLSITTPNIQLQDTHVLSATLMNVFSIGFNRFDPPATDPTLDGQWATKAGLKGLPPGQASDAFPAIAFAGPNSPTSWHTNASSLSYHQIGNSFVVGDQMSWIRTRHSMTFGFNLHLWQDNINNPSTGSTLGGPTGPSAVGGNPGGLNFSNTETAGLNTNGGLVTTTGNSYASFLLGAVDNAGLIESAAGTTGGRYRQYALFFQDDFKVTRRLTLNLGMRWELPLPYTEVADRLSFLNPSRPNPALNGFPGALEFAGNGENSCHCRNPFRTHYKNFGPRIGFAYSLNEKTVLRGAYSIMYINAAALGGTGVTQSTGILGYLANPTPSSLDAGITPAFYWDNGFPAYAKPPFFDPTLNTGFNTRTPSGGFIGFGDPELAGKAPYLENWHFTIQRELSRATVLNVAYSGSGGHFLPTGIGRGIYSNQIDPKYLALRDLLRANATTANIAAANAIVPGVGLPYSNFQGTIGQMLLPFPQFNGISDIYGDTGNSSYHSLQVSAQRRFSKGLQFLMSYTFNKSIDDSGNNLSTGAGSGRTAYNNHLEKAIAAQSVPHQLVISYVYQLPFGAGHRLNSGNAVLRQVISDWRLAGIQSYIKGRPVGVVGATCNVPYAGGCYADYAPGFTGNVRINGSYDSGNLIGSTTTVFLDKNAFANPAGFTVGNTPRTFAYGLYQPPTLSEDLNVSREFKIKEAMAFEIRADAFNVLNRVRFGTPSLSITSANFGKVSSQANTPRGLQFAARFSF